MWASAHRQKSDECLWLPLLTLSAYSIETGSLPKPGSHFSASLEACKPSYPPVSTPLRAGVQCLWGIQLVMCTLGSKCWSSRLWSKP